MPQADPRRARRFTATGGVRIGSEAERLRVLPSERRPLAVREAEAIRKDLFQPDPAWFVIHRRGVRRPWVGADPMEARAVSEFAVKGYLHERICYRWFTSSGFVPGVDFDFQSSQDGGRQDIGGLVVDFLFEQMRIAFGVDGPQHQALLQARKDEEQRQLLAEMGYWSISIPIEVIQNEAVFDRTMREIFLDRAGYNNFDRSPDLTRELEEMEITDSIGDVEAALIRLEQIY
jgi:hypothetical protein